MGNLVGLCISSQPRRHTDGYATSQRERLLTLTHRSWMRCRGSCCSSSGWMWWMMQASSRGAQMLGMLLERGFSLQGGRHARFLAAKTLKMVWGLCAVGVM